MAGLRGARVAAIYGEGLGQGTQGPADHPPARKYEGAFRGDRDIAGTYLGLLCENRGEGIIEVRSEAELSELSGCGASPRGVRAWRERIRLLEQLGLLRVFPRGSQSIGFVAVVHPDSALKALRKARRLTGNSDGWWNLYQSKLREVGAEPSADAVPKRNLRVVGGKGE